MQEEPWLPSDKPQGQQQIKIEDRVRGWVEGMATLVISNRPDPELEKNLSDKLGLDITWAICDTRRAQAQAKAIRRKKYDLVIGQTGFMGHGIESIIAQAAKDVGVPYIRANKARPQSTALALIRDLGLDISKEPPKSDRIRVSAPPEEKSNGRIRRRRIVTVPNDPKEFKDLDLEILRFLETQKGYFHMEQVLRAIKGIPLVLEGDGKINFSKMRVWTAAIGTELRRLNYVNGQVSGLIDPRRPRVWVRRDRQYLLNPNKPRPADAEDSVEEEDFSPSKPIPTSGAMPLRSTPRAAPGGSPRSQVKWTQKYERAVRGFARGRMYVHPEDVLREAIGLDVPENPAMQDYMFWTKNIARILRKMGFLPRSRNTLGTTRRVWIHKKAPPGMYIAPPGSDYDDPNPPGTQASTIPFPDAPVPEATPEPEPAFDPQPVFVTDPFPDTPAPRPEPEAAVAAGPKSVRVSFSSIQGGTMEEITLLLTQAGWTVSFGP